MAQKQFPLHPEWEDDVGNFNSFPHHKPRNCYGVTQVWTSKNHWKNSEHPMSGKGIGYSVSSWHQSCPVPGQICPSLPSTIAFLPTAVSPTPYYLTEAYLLSWAFHLDLALVKALGLAPGASVLSITFHSAGTKSVQKLLLAAFFPGEPAIIRTYQDLNRKKQKYPTWPKRCSKQPWSLSCLSWEMRILRGSSSPGC